MNDIILSQNQAKSIDSLENAVHLADAGNPSSSVTRGEGVRIKQEAELDLTNHQNKRLPPELHAVMQVVDERKDLSWAARGVLAYYVLRPDAPFTLEHLRSIPARRQIGRDLGKAIMNELVVTGYFSLEGKNLYYLKKRIPESLRQQVFERDGYRCVECESIKRLSVDHIVPERHGGTMELNNLRTLCKPCNSEKGSKIIGGDL